MAHPEGLDFLVHKTDWKQHRFDEAPAPEAADGQVLFRVDRFAFTANNISYALAGDMLGYWRFFPAPEGWGRLPVMGFADVIESRHADVAIACAFRFLGEAHPSIRAADRWPALAAHSERCEALDAFSSVTQRFIPPS